MGPIDVVSTVHFFFRRPYSVHELNVAPTKIMIWSCKMQSDINALVHSLTMRLSRLNGNFSCKFYDCSNFLSHKNISANKRKITCATIVYKPSWALIRPWYSDCGSQRRPTAQPNYTFYGMTCPHKTKRETMNLGVESSIRMKPFIGIMKEISNVHRDKTLAV